MKQYEIDGVRHIVIAVGFELDTFNWLEKYTGLYRWVDDYRKVITRPCIYDFCINNNIEIHRQHLCGVFRFYLAVDRYEDFKDWCNSKAFHTVPETINSNKEDTLALFKMVDSHSIKVADKCGYGGYGAPLTVVEVSEETT